MYAKIRNVIMCILTAVIIICLLTVTLTFGRFTKEEESGGGLGSDISFTVSNQMEVKTVEELFVAIANGYSYVKVADDMENPLVVSSAIVNVGSDLIIDLNGHDLQRNNRDAMLNIKENVRVTVIDSSASQTGSLYNPVGSVLQIGGGTLTVSTGKFESGPRAEEYNTYTAEVGQYPTHGSISVSDEFKGELFVKKDSGYSSAGANLKLPVIKPVVTKTKIGDGTKSYYYANGNFYLNQALSGYEIKDENGENINYFAEDTYIYYSIADSAVESNGLYSSGSADFYYSYYAKKTVGADNAPSYSGAVLNKSELQIDETKGEKAVAVTVYGYNNVIAAAENSGGGYDGSKRSDFAAIKMLDGDLQVCGGTYVSNFGVKSAYCVYAAGGNMVVDDGTFYANKEGVCVSCNYADASDSLRVTRGNFKSYRGDTIQMTAGTMTVTGGTFVKDSTDYIGVDSTGNEIDAGNHNNSAINIYNGTITLESTSVTPINFYLAGRFMAAIRCGTGATIYSTGVNYQFGTTDGKDAINGGNNIGIYSQGGSVNVRGCKFIQPGDYSYGIFSLDSASSGTAQINASSSIFSLGGKRCVGIYANGGTINVGRKADMTSQETIKVDGNTGEGYPIETYTMFYLDHVANCYGIYVADTPNTLDTAGGVSRSATRINVYAGQFVIGSGTDTNATDPKLKDKPYGVTEQPKDPNDTNVDDNDKAWISGKAYSAQQLIEEEHVWSAGVYLNQTGASVGLGRVRMIIGGDYSAGIFVESGEVIDLYGAEASGQTESGITAPTTVLFVGTTLRGYKNGGHDELTLNDGIDWAYLYKRDLDYVQNENFMSYYDRIVNCDSHYEYGVAAKGGNVDIGRIYINLRSISSRGIFASGGDTTVDNLIADIDNQVWTKSGTDKEPVFTDTAPETLTTTAMTIRNGNVTINDADIFTSGIGILLNFGQLTFNGDIQIQSINTSPIYITSTAMAASAGSKVNEGQPSNTWTIGASAKVNIDCTLTAGKPFDDTAQKFTSDTVDPTQPIPWQLNQSKNAIKSYNGVNIKGGSLIGDGELVVKFRGLDNKNQTKYDPYNMSLSSCAINVEKLTDDKPQVQLWHAHVTSKVGGGISVKGGDVTLGAQTLTDAQKTILKNDRHKNDKNQLVEIVTSGNTRYDKLLGGHGNWSYYPSRTGGPGIKVSDGSIKVHYGTYSAAQGNGILVSSGTATVHNGVFTGDNTAGYGDALDSNGSGVASYYGFMLRGGGTLTIQNGDFEGFNGGAFVTGSSTNRATATVNGGTYKSIGLDTSTRTTNGFSVGNNATVTIGQATTSSSAPQIAGYGSGIAIEYSKTGGFLFTDTKANMPEITVQGGTVVTAKRDGNGFAIWQGNEGAKLSLGECTLNVAGVSNKAIGTLWGNWTNDTDYRYWGNVALSGLDLKMYVKKTAESSYGIIDNFKDNLVSSAVGNIEYRFTTQTL